MPFYYSVLYNGLMVYLCLAAGIVILCFAASYRKYLARDTLSEWWIASLLLIFNSIVKTIFYKNIQVHIGLPEWFSPIFDTIVIVMALWVIVSIWRMKKKC